jgi:hypothetical protein
MVKRKRRRREEKKPEERYPYRSDLGSGFTPGQGGHWDAPDWTQEPVFEDIGEDGQRHYVPRRRI